MAQLVEHHLAKVGVAGSNPVVRSRNYLRKRRGLDARDGGGESPVPPPVLPLGQCASFASARDGGYGHASWVTEAKRSNTKYAIALAMGIVLLAAVMVWSVEHDNPASSIHSLTDALWWAVTTVTTVGYADKYPARLPEGKAIAITLMVLGIAVFGLVSATLASLFVENDTKAEYEDLREQMGRKSRPKWTSCLKHRSLGEDLGANQMMRDAVRVPAAPVLGRGLRLAHDEPGRPAQGGPGITGAPRSTQRRNPGKGRV